MRQSQFIDVYHVRLSHGIQHSPSDVVGLQHRASRRRSSAVSIERDVAPHRRVDRSRGDESCADAGRPQFLAQYLMQRPKRVFRRRISSVLGEDSSVRDGSDCNYMPAATPPQFLDECPHDKKRSDEVGPNDFGEQSGGHGVESGYAEHPCVVDDDVRHTSERSFDLASHLQHRGFIGNVAAHGMRGVPNRLGDSSQGCFIACDEGNAHTFAGECV